MSSSWLVWHISLEIPIWSGLNKCSLIAKLLNMTTVSIIIQACDNPLIVYSNQVIETPSLKSITLVTKIFNLI
jgi:hypothetical protein